MKKVVNAGIGGRSFTINEDAYARLENYLSKFRSKLKDVSAEEVMDDIESRIAELFSAEVGSGTRVVDLDLVEKVISQLGMPDGSNAAGSTSSEERTKSSEPQSKKGPRKMYRDSDDRRIAGVCSGLSLYFDIDVVIIRILMLVAFIVGSAGGWIYLILWIVVPKAMTPAEKCELRGLAPTAENMARFSSYKK